MLGLMMVAPADVKALWPDVRDFINEAIDAGERLYPERHYYEACARGDMQLWISLDGETCKQATITKIYNYPLKRRCTIVCCGGEGMADWINNIIQIEQWARESGCNSIQLTGRKGWGRVLKDWDKQGSIIGKEL
tara:strand:- start:1375 stop:1779 length:405 start_codon:yes stop_codon:yes gene_type:complete